MTAAGETPWDPYAQGRRGWSVFRLDHPSAPICQGVKTKQHDPLTCTDRGKHPVPAHWSQAASTDPRVIAAWNNGVPVNVGIDCGKSGITGIDQDIPDGLRHHARRLGVVIPVTFEVITHDARSHLYFKEPDGVKIGNTGALKQVAGCDVRGVGGYLVAAGSLHQSGEFYRPVDWYVEPAEMPDWLLEILTAPKARTGSAPRPSTNGGTTRTTAYSRPSPDKVIPGPHKPDGSGDRHNELVRYAGWLRGKDIPDDRAAELMHEMWKRCEQPPDCDSELTADEAEAKRADVYARYPAGTSATESPQGGHPTSSSAEDNDHPMTETDTGSPATNARIRATRLSDLPRAAPPTWVAIGHLPVGLAVLAGEEGIGKSLWWVFVVAHITTGRALPCIRLPEGPPQDVIIVITEDSRGEVEARLKLAGADFSRIVLLHEEDDGSGNPVFPPDMDIIDSAARGLDLALVIVDSWVDTISDGKQPRDPQVTRGLIGPWKGFTERWQCCVLLLVNTNRERDASLRDQVGLSAELRKKARMLLHAAAPPESDGVLVIGPDKANGIKIGPAVQYTLEAVQVRERTSHDPGTAAHLVDPQVTGDQRIRDLVAEWREEKKASENSGTAGEKAERWVREVMTAHGGRISSASMEALVAQSGHSEKRVRAAFTKIGTKKPCGQGQPWEWVLNGTDEPGPVLEPPSNTADTANTGFSATDSSVGTPLPSPSRVPTLPILPTLDSCDPPSSGVLPTPSSTGETDIPDIWDSAVLAVLEPWRDLAQGSNTGNGAAPAHSSPARGSSPALPAANSPGGSDLVGISSSQPSRDSQPGYLSGNVGSPTGDEPAVDAAADVTEQNGSVALCVIDRCWKPRVEGTQFCSQHPGGTATTAPRSGYQRRRPPRPAAS